MHSKIIFKDGHTEQVMGVPSFIVDENPQTVRFMDDDGVVISDEVELFLIRFIEVDLNEQG